LPEEVDGQVDQRCDHEAENDHEALCEEDCRNCHIDVNEVTEEGEDLAAHPSQDIPIAFFLTLVVDQGEHTECSKKEVDGKGNDLHGGVDEM
jgi:hypothetical protein